MHQKRIVKIVSNKRTWYEIVLAIIFYLIALYFIIDFYVNNGFDKSEIYYQNSFRVIAELSVLLGLGIFFSRVYVYHFDLKLNRYKSYWAVGPFGNGSWTNINKLDRVSTFLDRNGVCKVNIWDVENNKYGIASFDEVEDAVKYGRELAETLNIKFKERK